MPTTYFCSTSPKHILGANKLVSQVKFPDGQIKRASGTIRFKGHFAYSEQITKELNDMGREPNEVDITEADVINFIEESQPFKNRKIVKAKRDTVEKHHATEAAVQRLARADDDGIPEETITRVRENAAREMAQPVEETEAAGVDG